VEEVDSVDKDGGLVLPNVGSAKGLTDAVGGRDGVGVHHGDVEAIRKSPGGESVVQVGQAEENGASVAPRADHEDTKTAAMGRAGVRHLMSDFHGGYSFANLGLVTLRRDGQGRGGLLQPRMVGFRLGWVGYRDKDLGSGLQNEAETGHQEVGISLVEPDIGLVVLSTT